MFRCMKDVRSLICNFALRPVSGTLTSPRCCRSRSLWRGSHQSNTTTASYVFEWWRRSRGTKRRFRRENHSRQTGAVSEEHGWADGEWHFKAPVIAETCLFDSKRRRFKPALNFTTLYEIYLQSLFLFLCVSLTWFLYETISM